MNDKIYRQEAIDAICNCCYNNGETGDYRQCEYYRNEESSFCDFIAALRKLPFENDTGLYVDGFHDGYKQAQMDTWSEPLTDKEQRIFLAAMAREEKVCEEVDRNYVREPYEDSLVNACKEIRRKVKGALWT